MTDLLARLEQLEREYEAHKNDPYSYAKREIIAVRDYESAIIAAAPALLRIVAAARRAEEALTDLHACNDLSCQEPNCNHALVELHAALAELDKEEGTP